MFRIQTRGDLIYYLVLCMLVTAMGVRFRIANDATIYESRAPQRGAGTRGLPRVAVTATMQADIHCRRTSP
jgi:hypothetical protein